MKKGINLSLTKSLARFDALLGRAIVEVFKKKSVASYGWVDTNVSRFQVGKYVEVNSDSKTDETPVFWVGYGWEEKEKSESRLWIEFNTKTCPSEYWEKLVKLIGTSGKYYSEIDSKSAEEYSMSANNSESIEKYMNTWVHFYLRDEYLKQFFDENIDIDTQREILTGFINEVVEKW